MLDCKTRLSAVSNRLAIVLPFSACLGILAGHLRIARGEGIAKGWTIWMDSGEPPPPPDRSERTRGERGGKAARKQKELRERTLRGEYVPKAWTKSLGSKEVAVEKAPPVPPLGTTVVFTEEVVSLQERLSAVRAKAGLPTVSSFVSVVDTVEESGASSSLGIPGSLNSVVKIILLVLG